MDNIESIKSIIEAVQDRIDSEEATEDDIAMQAELIRQALLFGI